MRNQRRRERGHAGAHGLFLACGSTGAGKTTLLHSLLAFLNTNERKIWTAEDPIEITRPLWRACTPSGRMASRKFSRASPTCSR